MSLQQLSRLACVALLTFTVACGDDEPDATNNVNNANSTNNANNVADMGDDTAVNNDVDAGDDMGEFVLPPQPWSVFEPGPYSVGYRRGMEVTYDAVGEPGRTFNYVVWYPTLETEGDPAKYIGYLRQDHIINDAPVAITEAAPLLVFSHGNSSLAEQSFFMTEFYASHGWIVVAPNHTGNTFADTQGAIDLTSGAFRPQDITALLDHLYALPDDDSLKGLISDDVVMTGHSFGGYTTLASAGTGFAIDDAVAECMAMPNDFCDLLDVEGVVGLFQEGVGDPRIDVAIPQTPGGFFIFQDELQDITIPTLVMTGGLDATLPNEEEGDPIWEAMVGPHMRLDIRRGGHFTFSNMCDLLAGLVPDDGCGPAFIEYALAFDMINAYSMAFARHHLFGDESEIDLLNGTELPWGTGEIDLSWKPESPLAP